jgi:uncharacterized membrane protein YgdD (TMEM256/DUF423 family)
LRRKGAAAVTSPRTQKLGLIAAALAGLAGAGGVVLSAVAAHGAPNPFVSTAAQILLIHAVAVLALAGIALASPRRGGWFLCAAALILGGASLFCGDLSARAFFQARLFPMAAPIGGTLLVFGWVFAAIAAGAALWRERA